MRLDRQITVKIAAPLLKRRKSRKPGIPILMYHSISEPKGNHQHPYFETCTSPKVFAQQMKYLYENNYQVISLTEATRILQSLQLKTQNSKHKTIKPVVLTFDDGFRDFHTAAAVMQQYGFTATVFLPTAYITDVGSAFKGVACLTWKEVGELRQAGFSFGSHTVNHPQLYSLGRQEIAHEIKSSKDIIENQLGESIEIFSYPYAFPDHDADFSTFIRDTLSKDGYKIGVTTRLGTFAPGDPCLAVKRIPVNEHDDFQLFRAKIDGHYNWLALTQCAYKKVKFWFYNAFRVIKAE